MDKLKKVFIILSFILVLVGIISFIVCNYYVDNLESLVIDLDRFSELIYTFLLVAGMLASILIPGVLILCLWIFYFLCKIYIRLDVVYRKWFIFIILVLVVISTLMFFIKF